MVMEKKRNRQVTGSDMKRVFMKDAFAFPGLKPGVFVDMDIHFQKTSLG